MYLIKRDDEALFVGYERILGLANLARPVFAVLEPGYPVQAVVFPDVSVVHAEVENLLSKGHKVRVHDAANDELRSKVATLEALRPHWAQGYSSDSMAAQGATSALVGLWGLLGVDNQTAAMEKLRALVAAPTAAAATTSEDARDAARYRFLVKDGMSISGRFTLVRADDSGRVDELHGSEYARVIDAAMSATQQEGKPG